jgi:hypothetical protein
MAAETNAAPGILQAALFKGVGSGKMTDSELDDIFKKSVSTSTYFLPYNDDQLGRPLKQH